MTDFDCGAYQCQDFRCTSSCDPNLGNGCADGYVCLQGSCAKSPEKVNGSTCSYDVECESRTCCYLAGVGVGHCVNDCHSRPDGVSCTLDEDCLNSHCTNGVCSTCGNQECGYVNGVLCGECPDGFLCNGTVCQERTCGPNLQYVCKDNSFYECNQGFIGPMRSSCGDTHFCDVTLQTNTCGNLFLADKAHSLLSLSQTFEAGGSEIRWFVYGADALDGIYDSELPKAFATSSLPYSPELHVTFVPGRYYFIGAQVLAGGTYAFEPALAAPPRMAFGRIVDSFCLLNGLNTTLSDRQANGVAVQQIQSIELVP